MEQVPAWVEIAKQLGVAVPLVIILFYLLRQANDERQRITASFLATLESTIRANADAMSLVTTSLGEIAASIREVAGRASAEHAQILEHVRRARRDGDDK